MAIPSPHPLRRGGTSRTKAGFTLVEILVAATITVVLVGILLRITTLTSTTVSLSTQKLSAFASARTAFDAITRNLSQATLNTYLDYYDASGNRRTDSNSSTFKAATYGRASDLQFVVQQNTSKTYYGQEVYFQAPRAYSTNPNLQSVDGLLNACGYYVQFGNSDLYEPTAVLSQQQSGTIPHKYRYRLMQAMEPTENLHVFTATALGGGGTTTDSSSTWLTNIKNGAGTGSVDVAPVADNVIALVVWPRLSVNDDPTGMKLLPASHAYSYDSQAGIIPTGPVGGPYAQSLTADQLPPDVQVTMVVLDEASAIRAQGTATTAPASIESDLSGKFTIADNYATDMTDLATKLSAQHYNFQFFNTTVALRESKWTTPQN